MITTQTKEIHGEKTEKNAFEDQSTTFLIKPYEYQKDTLLLEEIKVICQQNQLPNPIEMDDEEEDCLTLVWSTNEYYATCFIERDGSTSGVYCPKTKPFKKYRSENCQDLSVEEVLKKMVTATKEELEEEELLTWPYLTRHIGQEELAGNSSLTTVA